ncbi:thioredoxin [Aliidongia dinghuensis]|uniref:Thioredoxin n=1 Tax=Aliidongia dinghuensis TaxID=1867774 RepID=A0A8J3E7U2_9PROT|nr:thioredoxin [Aliidongia dinghuensis]GGF49541.1 thioredoxin [Aliidongia dinghuensis]
MEQIIGSAPVAANLIKETTTEAFMTDVIDASMEVPVIVDFWAPWCGPCKQLTPIIEKAVKAANGAVKLVKLNIDDHPEIPTQMRVQSIPAVYAFKNGRPVDGFVGAQPESQVKAFIQRLAGKTGPSPIDEAIDMAKQALNDGDAATAQNLFTQVLRHQPDNVPAIAGLARVALGQDAIEDAKEILAQLPPDGAKHADVISVKAAIELAEGAAAALGATAEFEARLARDPADHDARLELANALFAAGDQAPAIDHLLQIVRADREWNDQAARKQLLKLFEALGPTHPLTVQARKRLSSILFS